jgi:hypothetical protein
MIGMTLNLDGDNAWPDLAGRTVHHIKGSIAIAGLKGGMGSGAASVGIRVDINETEAVVAETSLALFLSAADALKIKYGDPRRK